MRRLSSTRFSIHFQLVHGQKNSLMLYIYCMRAVLSSLGIVRVVGLNPPLHKPGFRLHSCLFSLLPAAQAVHPGLSGGVLRRPGRQLQGPLLHGDQPLQHGQADHLALCLPLAAGRAAARRQASERREPLSWWKQTETSRCRNRRAVKCRNYRQKKKKRHKYEQLHVYAKR